MNRQILHLFGLALVLFAVLLGATSWWSVFRAKGLEDNPLNRRPLIAEQQVARGRIVAADGTVLARSIPRGRGKSRVYRRTYPTGPLFSHAVGYDFVSRGRAGLERSRNDALTGKLNEFGTIFRELQSRRREGSSVVTTLDPAGQRAALQALGGRRGAVVALEPATGRVRVMVSVPEFDANQIPDRYGVLSRDAASPLFNRATQASYPPGSTFKVVTAAAALDSGAYTPDSVIDGRSPRIVSGVPLTNDAGESFGPITLTEALTKSVNTVFAQIGERLGTRTLERYMQRFGFNQDPPLDYPGDQMNPSGVRNSSGRIVTGGFDVGRVALGQGGGEGQIQVTPLQMALVAAAVGNRGRLMRPWLTERIVDPDGRVTERFAPQEQSTVMSQKAADQLKVMMSKVVQEGTGTAAALQGIQVAGKTGTAEVDGGRANQAWFIAFAPLENPRMAIAATVERTQGFGGPTAGPIAKAVLEALLRR